MTDKKYADIIRGEDWVGIYIEGKLVFQGHSVNEYALLTAMGYTVTQQEADPLYAEMGEPYPETTREMRVKVRWT